MLLYYELRIYKEKGVNRTKVFRHHNEAMSHVESELKEGDRYELIRHHNEDIEIVKTNVK